MEEDGESLKEVLARRLGDGACLVVLDDAWSSSVCDEVLSRLRNAGVSRVLTTARTERVNKLYFNMRFLDDEKSWNLLRQGVFGNESSLPAELEKAKRKIAENCGGISLLILAVAEILRGDEKMDEQ